MNSRIADQAGVISIDVPAGRGSENQRQLSRRSFLARSAALAGAGLAARWGQAAEAAKSKLSLGVQSYSLRGYKVDQAIQHAKDLGFAHLEFYPGHFSPDSKPNEIEEMKSKVASAGMKIMGHGVNRFTKDHEANLKLFKFAKAAGIKNLSADPDPDSFESLERLVDDFDIRIAIHNHGPDHRYDKVVDVLRAVEKLDERIGACADLGHFIRSGEDPVEVIRVLGKRVFGIHLKDFAEQKKETRGVILGKGHLDVEAVFRALIQVGFPEDGCLSLEYEENEKNPIADIRECVAVAKEALTRAEA
jgi:sugar phosphate isomerase/epimerase